MRNCTLAAVAATVALLLLSGCAANNGPHPIRDRAVIDDPKLAECFAETPIPRDAFSEKLLMQSDDPYLGVWTGEWVGEDCHTLIITPRTLEGEYDVLYISRKAGILYASGYIEWGSLHLDFISYDGPEVVYSLQEYDPNGMGGYYSWPGKKGYGQAELNRIPLQTLEASIQQDAG